MSKLRRYTDEELGRVEATMDRPRAEMAAELGRSIDSISDMRKQIRRGWSRVRNSWTDEEMEVICREDLTHRQMADKLPGRSVSAIATQRSLRGLSMPKERGRTHNPRHIGTRTLIAKTCPNCGDLLPSTWFRWEKGEKWSSWCRKCSAKGAGRVRSQKARDAYFEAAQALTIPLATRKGQEYTEADHEILSDESITQLEKALRTKRTYAGVATAMATNGYKSRKALDDPRLEAWRIENPNADRIEEITAMLTKSEPATPTRPDFEWDD